MPFYVMFTLFVTVSVLIAITWDQSGDGSEAIAWALVFVLWCIVMIPLLKAAW